MIATDQTTRESRVPQRGSESEPLPPVQREALRNIDLMKVMKRARIYLKHDPATAQHLELTGRRPVTKRPFKGVTDPDAPPGTIHDATHPDNLPCEPMRAFHRHNNPHANPNDDAPTPTAFDDLEAFRDQLLPPPLRGANQIDPITDAPYGDLSTQEARERLVRSILTRSFARPRLSYDDLLPQRVHTAWRLVREIARTQGRLKNDDLLAEAFTINSFQEAERDPWLIPMPLKSHVIEQKNVCFAAFASLMRAEKEEDSALPAFYVHEKDENGSLSHESLGKEVKVFLARGMSLLPPGIPYAALDPEGVPHLWYTPHQDTMLATYIIIIQALADHLGMWSGSRADPELGRMGLRGLLDPMLVRDLFPTRLQLLTWEAMIVDETLNKLLGSGVPITRQWLSYKYGLTEDEITGVVKMARRAASVRTASEIEDEKSIMVLRLEDYIRRCRETTDMRGEMLAMKQLAIVHGFAQVEANDEMTDFINIVKGVSAARRQAHTSEQIGTGPAKRVLNEAPERRAIAASHGED